MRRIRPWIVNSCNEVCIRLTGRSRNNRCTHGQEAGRRRRRMQPDKIVRVVARKRAIERHREDIVRWICAPRTARAEGKSLNQIIKSILILLILGIDLANSYRPLVSPAIINLITLFPRHVQLSLYFWLTYLAPSRSTSWPFYFIFK